MNIQRILIKTIMLQSTRIICILVTCERSPPIAGPMRNAIPKAAPIYPIFFVLFSGLEISEIYAWMTPKPAPPSHPTNRARRNKRKSGVNPWKIVAICVIPIVRLSHEDISAGLVKSKVSVHMLASIMR
jgi:hypothetical protein